MNKQELTMLQALPLDIKIAKSKLRIEEFVRHMGGEDKVYISFSGGKDSTVLLHLVRSIYPNIEAVFVDTGLEFPEIKEFVKKFENVKILRPKLSFKQVIEKYGYPVVSKEQSQYIYQYRTAKSEKTKLTRLNGNKWGRGKISEKHKYLLNAPFKISDKCCDVMKKTPVKQFEKQTGKAPIIGVMASESSNRQNHYMKTGCNSFDGIRPISKPLGFWKEQDILSYIKKYNLNIASVYGELIEDNEGKLKYNLRQRTGCVYCMYGMSLEKENRFLILEKTHPQLHNYCMNNLGFKSVCEYMGIKYSNNIQLEGQLSIEDLES